MLVFLNILFTILHIVITLFNVVGWIFPKTRKLHLITIGLTFGSWFILGFWYGFGYCFLTDWHWDVKKKLGETDLPSSFIKYFADKITGKDISATLVNNVTLIVFILTIILTIYYNFFHRRNRIIKKGMNIS